MTERAMRPFLLALLALFALSASVAQAALPPRPPGPVADIAAMIPDGEEAALDAKLRAYNKATGRAIIVATVPSLDGQVVERYAQDLARAWEIGGEESEEGVLVLVAPSERKIHIHAAVGAQGRLTDGVASRIIREAMTPKFKAGNFGGGISAGVDQIIAQLDRDEIDARAVAEAAEAAKSNARSSDGIGVGSVIFWIVLILFFLMLFGRRRRGYRRGFRRGVGVWDVGEVAANVAINVALNAALGGDGDGGGSDSGFGGFGGGGSGFDGGGASGDW